EDGTAVGFERASIGTKFPSTGSLAGRLSGHGGPRAISQKRDRDPAQAAAAASENPGRASRTVYPWEGEDEAKERTPGLEPMSMIVNTNLASMNAQKNLSTVTSRLQGNYSRLSSGLRITNASEDAAGLEISERLRSKVR